MGWKEKGCSYPYKFSKSFFVKEKTGTLKVPVRELEEHLKNIYSENQRHVPATIPTNMPSIQLPVYQMDTRPPTWSEIESSVKWARSASAHRPNGVLYSVYKNTGLLKYLWHQMKVAWKKVIIPKVWGRAGGILIPKEKSSLNINQFRPDQPAKCWRENFLQHCGSKAFGVLAEKQLCWNLSAEGRDKWLLRMFGAWKHYLTLGTNCQKGKEGPACGFPWPCQHLCVSATRDNLDGVQLLPGPREHNNAG